MSEGAGSGLRALIIEPTGSGREALGEALERRGFAVVSRDQPESVERTDLDPSPDLLLLSCRTEGAAKLVASVLGDPNRWPPLVVGFGDEGELSLAVIEAGADAFLRTSDPTEDLERFLDRQVRRQSARGHWRRMVERLVPLERAVASMQLGLTIADPDGRVLYANPAEEKMHGYGQGELVGTLARSLSTPDRSDALGLHRRPAIQSWLRESINRRKDGTTFPVQLRSDLIFGPGGRLAAVVTTSEDITQRLEAEARLRSLSKAVETMQLGLTITDLQGRILFVNPAEARMHGYASEELVGSDVGVYTGASLRRPMRWDEIRAITRWQRESTNVAKDGREFPVRLLSDVVLSAEGDPLAVVTTCEDISERRRTEEQLRQTALHDALTGLPNRAVFLDRLGLALSRMGRRPGYGFGVLFIDLDRFKIINDSMGHAAGDRCLIEVGQRLVSCVRSADTVSRLGGDEFAVLVDDVNSIETLTAAAGRIQERLSEPMSLDGQSFFTSASIGIASTAAGYAEPADILRDADNAMYRAKALGGGRAEIFDSTMYRAARVRLETESELRPAMGRGQLELHYQPIVRLDTGQLAGFESLIRWKHPLRGMVSPGEFIPIAEESGLIRQIGSWVIKNAIAQIGEWNREIPSSRDGRVSINVSALQFDQGNLVEEIARALESADVAPTSLALEVTESAVLRNRALAAQILGDLRDLGITVYLDDFGTGYSSLSLLHELPVDTIKIDRSFVGRIGAAGENSEIVQSVIALGHGLGLSVLAEGIETAVQLAQMRALRCEYGQGWYFHRAVPAEEASAFLRDGLPNLAAPETPRITQGIPRSTRGTPRPPLGRLNRPG